MSELTAQARGAAKQVAQMIKGRTGIYATLAKEHGELASLLQQAIKTSSGEKRADLLDKIRVELLSHARAEEESLYATLARFEQTRAHASHSKNEHQEIESLLQDALQAGDNTERQTSLLKSLRDVIEHHVDEEENDLFVKADDLLSRTDESELDERFRRLKDEERRKLEGNGAGWSRVGQ